MGRLLYVCSTITFRRGRKGRHHYVFCVPVSCDSTPAHWKATLCVCLVCLPASDRRGGWRKNGSLPDQWRGREGFCTTLQAFMKGSTYMKSLLSSSTSPLPQPPSYMIFLLTCCVWLPLTCILPLLFLQYSLYLHYATPSLSVQAASGPTPLCSVCAFCPLGRR